MPKMRLPKSSFTGKQPEAPSVADFAGMGEITLLSKAKVLENLLNHIEDLKGTPFEAAAKALADKAPWVFGHINRVDTKLPAGGGMLGGFKPDRGQVMAGPLKGRTIGDISLNPHDVDKAFQASAADVLGHEAAHGAQSLFQGAGRQAAEYQRLNNRFMGYSRNPYEHGAKKAGVNLRRATEGKPRKR